MLQKLSEGEGMKFDSTRVARPVTAKVDSSLDLKVDSRIWPEVWSRDIMEVGGQINLAFTCNTVIDPFRQKYFTRAPFSRIDDNETCFIYAKFEQPRCLPLFRSTVFKLFNQ